MYRLSTLLAYSTHKIFKFDWNWQWPVLPGGLGCSKPSWLSKLGGKLWQEAQKLSMWLLWTADDL